MRTYEVSATVTMTVSDHADNQPSLVQLDRSLAADAINSELPVTLWIENDDGDEHGYDIHASHVVVSEVKRTARKAVS